MSIPGSAAPFLLAQQPAEGAYKIERSLRFNSSDSAYLSRTPSVAGNRKTWTWAGWVKFSAVSGTYGIFEAPFQSGGNGVLSDAFEIWYNGGIINLTDYGTYYFTSAAQFRDPSAWQHFTFVCDTTQATASNRFKVYHNGVQLTNTAAGTITQNLDTAVNNSVLHTIGQWRGISANAYFADVHLIDGQALDPTSFGEFDTNGVWQPKAYEGTYGTNGFHLPFSDNSTAAALGTDTSGNGNNWTPVNFSVSSTNYVKDCTGTPFNSGYSFENMFDGSTSTYMTPSAETWAVFEPSAAIPVTTFEVFGGWSSATASLAPKVNDVDVTNAPLNSVYQWFTPTLSGGVPITSLSKFEFYTASASQAFLVSAIRINGTILISNPEGNDSLVDSPTNYGTDSGAGGEVRGNYCTLNPLDNGGLTLSNGNLQFDRATASWISGRATIGMSSGKWYWEVVQTTGTSMMVGISKGDASQSSYVGAVATGWAYNSGDGNKYNNASNSAYGNTYTTNDVIGVAFDVDSGDLKFYKNGTVQNSGTAAYTGLTSGPYFPAVGLYGTATAFTNFGQRPFAYTAPSGFKALCTTNLEPPTIADGSTAMDVTLWTGDNTSNRVITSSLKHDPDLVWVKARNASGYEHAWFDALRSTNMLASSNIARELDFGGTTPVGGWVTNAGSGTGGFTVTPGSSNAAYVNQTGVTYVAWTWDAGSSTVTNTQGSITSQVRANPGAGFSIMTATQVSGGGSIGHGLGVAPAMYIVKTRSNAIGWFVNHRGMNQATDLLILNATDAKYSATTYWNNTAPTSTVLHVGNGTVLNGDTFVCYAFAPVAGYSSFGSYTGNGIADGPFVYTGFRPRWVMVKRTDPTGNWVIWDAARSGYNAVNDTLAADSANTENALTNNNELDILSNGFKLRISRAILNASGGSFIYAAFAEHPFATSRAR